MVANYLDSNIKHNMRKKMDFTCEFHMGEPGLNQGKHIEKTFSESVQNTCLFLLCEYIFWNHSVLRGRKTNVPSDERNCRTVWRHEFKREKMTMKLMPWVERLQDCVRHAGLTCTGCL